MAETREIIVLDLRIDEGDLTRKIADNTAQLDGMKKQLKDLKATAQDALEKGLVASAEEATEAAAKLENEIRGLQTETKRYKSTIDETSLANKANVGSYEQLYRQWKLQETQLKNMEGAIQKNADGTFSLTQKYLDESAAVKQAKDALLQFNKGVLDGRLNVGNYDNSIQGLEQKLGDLSALFKQLDSNSPEFEKTRDAIAETRLQIDQLSGKVDEFGNREPKNLAKKGFEDATDAANGLIGAFTLLTLLQGKDGETSEAAAAAMKAMAIATAAANVVKGYQGMLDTLALVRKKLLVREIASETVATEVQAVATAEATVAQEGLNVAMEANPIGILIVGLVALGAALYGLNAYMTSSSDETERLADENERLTKTLGEQNRLLDNKIAVGEAELNLMQAQGASAEEIRKKEEEINAEKKQSLLNNIKLIESTIALDKSKIADVETNDSLYESYLKAASAVYRFLGLEETANETEKLIAANKAERSQEFVDDLKKQEDALAQAQAALVNQQADELKADADAQKKKTDAARKAADDQLKADADAQKKKTDAARKAADDQLKINQQLIDSQNRLIADARQRELTENVTALNRRLDEIKGNSKAEVALRASITEESRQKEQEINAKYDALDLTERLKAKETELQLELSGMQEAGAEKLAVQLELLDVQKQEELAHTDLSEQEKANIEEKYRQAKIKAEQDMNAKINADFAKAQQDKLQAELIQLQVNHENTTAKLLELAALRRDQVLENENSTQSERLLAIARYNQEEQDIMMQMINDIKIHYGRIKATVGNVASSIGSIMEVMGANQDQMNEFLKATAIAQLGIDTAMAISATVAQAMHITFPGNLLAITAGIAMVLSNIATAKKYIDGSATPQAPQIQGFAEGGANNPISGTRIMTHHGVPANGPKGDNRLVYAKTNEVILNEQQQARLGGASTFAAIGVPGFSSGGFMDTINSFTSSISSFVPSFAGGGLMLQDFTAPIDQGNMLSQVLQTVDNLARRPSIVTVEAINAGLQSEAIRLGRADI